MVDVLVDGARAAGAADASEANGETEVARAADGHLEERRRRWQRGGGDGARRGAGARRGRGAGGALGRVLLARASRRGPALAKDGAAKPAHYKVICISLYTKDLERLDGLVDELKARGITKANRSALIRVALDQVDLDKVPRGM